MIKEKDIQIDLDKEQNYKSIDEKNNNKIEDEFVEVISIQTGKVKRMRFTYELRNKKKEK